ncbi:MAG TPA: hypothetical protein VF665_21585 [Longimicrobium sp.]|jgi:hypothetical protein|uniref:hypothetical protein n=1 Tax=Longimicrobium sp. TaxID=2029185 RepID=UPI002ED77B83
MNIRILAGAALLALASPALCAAQRDTIRIGQPRDTARVPTTRRDSVRITVPRDLPPPADTRPWIPARPDTVAALPETDSVFDSAQTQALVNRVIQSGSTVPAGLDDYLADMRSAIYLSIRSDTAQGGEIPVTVDELAGEVRWARGGAVEQTIQGHRIRLLAPTPYTVGSMLEAPWIVPHLYGNTIDIFSLAATPANRSRVARAIHPFSFRGIDFYRYTAGDTVRVTTREGRLSLVPVTVRPRPGKLQEASDNRLVAGTFYVDVDRAAIARARFGFVERGGALAITETGVFFELESGLVGGRYWLPYRQRREIQVSSPLLGGAAAIRLVTMLSDFQLNQGWTPQAAGSRLVWRLENGAFAGWRGVGDETDVTDIADFADLRGVVRPPGSTRGVQIVPRYRQSDHLFRFNRVEGAFLGLGARVQPADPDRRDWDVYAHAGYAFSEGTARGELIGSWHPDATSREPGARYSATAGVYRRLRDMTSFRPPVEFELGYTLSAALAGYDVRDYYDAAGAELFGTRRAGNWLARLGGRVERHDSVTRNTGSYAFGTAADFPLVAAAQPGTHAAAEATLRYARGSGAFGVSRGFIAQLTADQGLGDFAITRATALVSTRVPSRYLTLVGRADAGTVLGTVPPQFLYRFGGVEGLRGYARNEFGGTSAVLGRGRLLLNLPPYTSEPLLRIGGFLVPPLRPAIVVSGDAGWSGVNDRSAEALARLGARETDGVRSSYGTGLSFFEDAVSVEYVWPGDGGEGKWYAGFVATF